jgi:DNA-binding IclR family transcriptional regulator
MRYMTDRVWTELLTSPATQKDLCDRLDLDRTKIDPIIRRFRIRGYIRMNADGRYAPTSAGVDRKGSSG